MNYFSNLFDKSTQISETVQLIGFHYMNTLRSTVLWMSKAEYKLFNYGMLWWLHTYFCCCSLQDSILLYLFHRWSQSKPPLRLPQVPAHLSERRHCASKEENRVVRNSLRRRYFECSLLLESRLFLLTLNIPSLARQRCLSSWGPRRTPFFFCNFSTVWCGRLLKLCFWGF